MSDAILRFVGTDSGLSAQFSKANKSLDALEQNSNKTTAAISKGFGLVASALGAISLVELTKQAFEFSEQLLIASGRTGIAVESLQKLQFVAGQSETSFDAITTSINKFQVNLSKGSKDTTDALKGLGISIGEISALQPDQQFLKIAESIATVEDPAKRAQVAVALFGRGGTELLPLLRKGADGVAELSNQFDELGIAVSADTINKVDDLGDSFSRLGTQAKGLATELVALAAPLVSPLLEGASDLLRDVKILIGQADEITKLNEQIKFLEEHRGSVALAFKYGEVGTGILTGDEIEDRLRRITRLRDALIATNKAPPIVEIPLDNKAFGLPANIPGISGPAVLTPEQRRENAANSAENPRLTQLVADKDLELQINQDRIDEILKQDSELARRQIAADTDLAQFRRGIRETFGLDEISFEEAKNGTIIDLGTQLFGALARQNSKLAKIQQTLAIASIIYDTATSVMKAFAQLGYPAAIPVSAFLVAQGAIQIAKVKSTNYGSGGSVSGVSGGSVGGSASDRATPNTPVADAGKPGATQRPQSTINVYGWSEAAIRELVKRIKDEVGDHDLNLVRVS